MRITRSAVGIVGAALAVTVLGVLSTGAAHGEPNADVTWAVQPGNAQGADERTRIEVELEAGETHEDHVVVSNLSDAAVQFRLSAADGYFTGAGRFDMLPADRESVDAGRWISFETTDIAVGAGESAVVPIEIDVPDDAAPGDYPAGVAASLITSAEGSAGATMRVESRVGFRVMARVAGAIVPEIAVADLSASYRTNWRFWEPGSTDVAFEVSNRGNAQLDVTSNDEALTITDADDGSIALFPGDVRTVAGTIEHVWPLGFATARVDLTAQVPGSDQTASVSEQQLLWAMPWPQIAVVLGAAAIFWAVLWRRRRAGTLMEMRMEQAREAGRREVTGPV